MERDHERRTCPPKLSTVVRTLGSSGTVAHSGRRTPGRLPRCLLATIVLTSGTAHAAAPPALPTPLGLEDVRSLAPEYRAEIAAARTRVRAAERRPAIVSALEDPMIAPSLDHLPTTLEGADASVAIEQRFPLSRVRGHRQRDAEAETATRPWRRSVSRTQRKSLLTACRLGECALRPRLSSARRRARRSAPDRKSSGRCSRY